MKNDVCECPVRECERCGSKKVRLIHRVYSSNLQVQELLTKCQYQCEECKHVFDVEVNRLP